MKENFKFTFTNLNRKIATSEQSMQKQSQINRQVSYLKVGALGSVKFTRKQNELFSQAFTRKHNLTNRNVLNKLCQRDYSEIQKSIQGAFVIEEIVKNRDFNFDLLLEESG